MATRNGAGSLLSPALMKRTLRCPPNRVKQCQNWSCRSVPTYVFIAHTMQPVRSTALILLASSVAALPARSSGGQTLRIEATDTCGPSDPPSCILNALTDKAGHSHGRSSLLLGLDRAVAASIELQQTRQTGLWLEFGAFQGASTKQIAERVGPLTEGGRVHSFDSFQGLPSKWRDAAVAGPPSRRLGFTHKYLDAGSFNLKGKPPFGAHPAA